MAVRTEVAPIEQGSDLAVNAACFRRHVRASGLSPRTEQSYLESVTHLGRFLAARGMPLAVAAITREHLDEWLISLREAGRKPTTVGLHLRSVQQFFRWAEEEGLIKASPMAIMRPPKIPEAPPDILRDEELARLIKSVEADDSFAGRRDAAILRLFIASGARLSKIANLRWNPVDPTADDVDLGSSPA